MQLQTLRRFLCALLVCVPVAMAQNQSPPQNWAMPRPPVAPSKYYQNGWLIKPTAAQVCFSFTINPLGGPAPAGPQRQTSAGVFTSTGLIRTLWTNRAYNPGTYGECWNGLDDYGNAASAPFTIKVAYNNINYNWDGIIGSTEQSWNGLYTQDAMASGYITFGPVFQNGQMYAVTGYSEQHFNTPIYDRDNPGGPVKSLLPLVYNFIPTQSVSDGHRIYMLVQPYNSLQHGGIYCFTFDGNPCSLNGSYSATFNDMNTASLRVYELLGAQSSPQTPYPGLTVLDATKLNTGGSPTNTAVTGVAVQFDSTGGGSCATHGCLATAHGYSDTFHGGHGSGPTNIVNSLDTVSLWDKVTGASIATFSITNPQTMVFDKSGNLWVLSGYHGGGSVTTPNVLYEVTSVGGSNTVTQIGASTFLDPVAIAINPVNGHLFVADGGTHQQVFEVSTSAPTAIISTLGSSNGYNHSGSCNANIDPLGHNSPTFFFDPDITFMSFQFNTPFINWIQLDQQGDLWVGEALAFRVVHYTWNGSAWQYVNRISVNATNTNLTMVDPTRVFNGVRAFLEYSVNPNVQLQPGDPEGPGGNGSWDIARNWWPCIETTLGFPSSQYEMHAGSMLSNNGNVIEFAFSNTGAGLPTVGFQFNKNGTFTYNASSYPPANWPDASGNVYNTATSGTTPNITYTINKYAVTSFDSNGFPSWGSGTAIGSYTANASLPQATNSIGSFYPTSDNVIPIYQTAYAAPVGGAPVFHLGGLLVGGSSLQWAASKQVVQPWMNGDGTFPGVNLVGAGNGGTTAIGINTDIFAFFAGNNGPVGSNFFHYRSDGLVQGQFGWQTSFNYYNALNTFTNIGYPMAGLTYPYIGIPPGLEGDTAFPFFAQIGTGSTAFYQVYMSDQAIRAGIHRFSVTNLSSAGTLTATQVNLGSTVNLQ